MMGDRRYDRSDVGIESRHGHRQPSSPAPAHHDDPLGIDVEPGEEIGERLQGVKMDVVVKADGGSKVK